MIPKEWEWYLTVHFKNSRFGRCGRQNRCRGTIDGDGPRLHHFDIVRTAFDVRLTTFLSTQHALVATQAQNFSVDYGNSRLSFSVTPSPARCFHHHRRSHPSRHDTHTSRTCMSSPHLSLHTSSFQIQCRHWRLSFGWN